MVLLLVTVWLFFFTETLPVKSFSGTIFFVAAFFWAWAVKNTLKMGFDLGILSFFLVAAATLLDWKTDFGNVTFTKSSIGFVLFNYALGALVGHTKLKRRDFVVYCVVNLFFWGAVMSKF